MVVVVIWVCLHLIIEHKKAMLIYRCKQTQGYITALHGPIYGIAIFSIRLIFWHKKTTSFGGYIYTLVFVCGANIRIVF